MGQCGSKDKERKRFAPVPLPTAVLKIACGASHSMLVREPMFLVGFGRNDMGQLGLPGEKPPPIVKQPLVTPRANQVSS
jgi:alpha-tubulin suppressor-like RCC1 family protein